MNDKQEAVRAALADKYRSKLKGFPCAMMIEVMAIYTKHPDNAVTESVMHIIAKHLHPEPDFNAMAAEVTRELEGE